MHSAIAILHMTAFNMRTFYKAHQSNMHTHTETDKPMKYVAFYGTARPLHTAAHVRVYVFA